ncbi:hypothetical protein [Filimonas effusa]|uniref:Uncharacterized protein n=1 Tax=Filimonas effusa TaxID=2508721 RepID=A0A4Q1D1N8_9BACT|nr:hypothetical protein [Filimonas effusa]RXK81775.1 hypothetical protein ESB13_18460 [Filimonas effusa]
MMKMVRMLVPACMGISLIVAMACNSPAKQPGTVPVYHNDSVKFYPAQQFLRSQIAAISTTPYYIYKITEHDGRRDSIALNRQEFLAETAIFTSFSFEDSTVKKYYKETVFADQSINSITMDYTTRNAALPVQSAVVLLDPESQKVKRIMMDISEAAGDSVVTHKLVWKTNESCTIVTLVERKGASVSSQSARIVWNGN